MPTYDFRTESGESITAEFRMSEAPRVGASIYLNGVRCTRVWSDYVYHVAERNKPFSSAQVCPDLARRLGHTNFDKDGSPVFANQKEARTLADRSEGILKYGGMPTRSETDRHRIAANRVARSLRRR